MLRLLGLLLLCCFLIVRGIRRELCICVGYGVVQLCIGHL